MKILIVDDEQLTREGIVLSVDWAALGITEVLEADDGVNGLQMAKKHQPDIVLCDVRMPRMDGIAMLERIEALYPDSAAIFMSGYSDKEYLKAAIQLKAINYIEKPFAPKEIESAVREAVEQCQYRLRQKNAEEIHTNLAATQLAFQMTVPYHTCQNAIDELCSQFHEHYGMDKFKYVTTIIVKLEQIPDTAADLTYVHNLIHDFLKPMHLHIIYSEKRNYHIVYHIYGTLKPAKSTRAMIADRMGKLFGELGRYYIAVGDTVEGISKAYHSYESAVILLQSSYFFEPGGILYSQMIQEKSVEDGASCSRYSSQYINAVAQKEEATAKEALEALFQICDHAFGLMPNQIKSLYYEMLSSLYKERKNNQLLPDFSIENHENIMDIMENCFSYSMLHNLLKDKTGKFFEDISQNRPENSTIYMIRDYISSNYANSALSVKDISEYVKLSTSYLCTYFKNGTGVTLNQYITEFRLEKAKQLLSDPRYRINDVSSAVGYSDGNYFSKSFRKYTGLSPSEFREKSLK